MKGRERGKRQLFSEHARPHDKHGGIQSSAFQEKCLKEEEKLRTKMARQLQIDLETLLEEEVHPDLTLLLPGEKIPVHSAILRARAPFFFQDLLGSPAKSKKRLDSLDSCQVKFLLKQIYSADDLTEEANLVKQWVAAGLQAKTPSRDRNANTMRFQAPTKSSVARKRAGSCSPGRQRTDSSDRMSASPRGQGRGQSPLSGQPPSKPHGKSPPKDMNSSTTSSEGDGKSAKKKRLLSDDTPTDDVELDFPVDGAATKPSEDISCQETPLDPEPCSPLGASLLEMLRMGTGSDVTLVVDGRRMPAHRCILCVRSPYFAAMLGGSWKESNSREIKMDRVNPAVIQQVLLYMYGGVISLTRGCSLMELIAASDMYGILGLKEAASFQLRMEYCHFFHKPCSGCLGGVPDAIAIAYTYGLEDLLERALRWSGRYLARLWSSKTFALLPQEVLNRCCDAVINDLSTDNIVDTVTECDKLMGSLPQVHWSEPVVAMATRLMDGCIEHIRNNCIAIISTPKFLSLGATMALGMSFLEDIFSRALITMPTEKACPTYLAWQKLLEQSQEEDCTWSEDFRHLVRALNQKCEQFMTMHINQVVDTSEWTMLSQELQKKIKEGAWFVSVGDNRKVKAPPVLPSSRPREEFVRASTANALKPSSSCVSRLPTSAGRGRSGDSGHGAGRNSGRGHGNDSRPGPGEESVVRRRQHLGALGGARPKSTGSIGLKSGAASKLPAPSRSIQEQLGVSSANQEQASGSLTNQKRGSSFSSSQSSADSKRMGRSPTPPQGASQQKLIAPSRMPRRRTVSASEASGPHNAGGATSSQNGVGQAKEISGASGSTKTQSSSRLKMSKGSNSSSKSIGGVKKGLSPRAKSEETSVKHSINSKVVEVNHEVRRKPPSSPTMIPRSRPRTPNQLLERPTSINNNIRSSEGGTSMLPMTGKTLETQLDQGQRETVLANLALKNLNRLEMEVAPDEDQEEERSLSPCSNIATRDSTSTFDFSPGDFELDTEDLEVFSSDGDRMIPECSEPELLPWKLGSLDDVIVEDGVVMDQDDEEAGPSSNSEDMALASISESDETGVDMNDSHSLNSDISNGYMFYVDLLPPVMEVFFLFPEI